jgi:hypothetical protein
MVMSGGKKASQGDTEVSMVVVSPSFRDDFDLCADLHHSVIRYFPEKTIHYIVTPASDVELFSKLAGPQCVIWSVSQIIPRGYVPIPHQNIWMNLKKPWMPIRGWIMQQIVKLGAAERIGADILILADSDVVFSRPVCEDYFKQGTVRFYKKDNAIDSSMSRHVIWHQVARRILGLPPGRVPFTDYIPGGVGVFDRNVLLKLYKRIEEIHGRPWMDVIASKLHFSEFILYGVFVDEVLGRGWNDYCVSDTCVHGYWDLLPLDDAAAAAFVQTQKQDDIAIMISAKSMTPLSVRRAAINGLNIRPGTAE